MGRKESMGRGRAATVALTLVLAATTTTLGSALTATAGATPNPIGGHARFTVQSWGTVPPAGLPPSATTASVHTWTGSFRLNKTSYSFTMVGTNPGGGSATTTVPTEILPLDVKMADGVAVNASNLTGKLTASPILSDAGFTSGTTQLADAMQRAEFWTTVSTKAKQYHLLLGTPHVLPAVAITVPAADGTGEIYNGIDYANISYTWWSAKLRSIITAHSFSPTTLPLILSGNTFLYQNNNPADCCIYGYHGSYGSSTSQNTYAFANWLSAGLVASGNQDVFTMSHEVSEWANDPYVNNVVPRWDQPNGQTCYSNLLEVGDPIEALPKPWYTIKVGPTAFHPSDIAGLSWFSHANPSSEQNGLYSYHGDLTTPSTLC